LHRRQASKALRAQPVVTRNMFKHDATLPRPTTPYTGSSPPVEMQGAHSMMGRQVSSKRETSRDYTISLRNTFREPKGIARGQHKHHTFERVFHGEEFVRHAVPETPGPGAYVHRVGIGVATAETKQILTPNLGKQVLTKNRNPPACSFARSSRFGSYDLQRRLNATPGPGAYIG